ncbi:hypothetical protein VNO80_06485 [Phaseolus coccineus]|uniref:Uncharacterized protein n=1 Tax=Phaseolus coccineus TaxID=3886 RepID=A0AAN9NNW2_PHACN
MTSNKFRQFVAWPGDKTTYQRRENTIAGSSVNVSIRTEEEELGLTEHVHGIEEDQRHTNQALIAQISEEVDSYEIVSKEFMNKIINSLSQPEEDIKQDKEEED